MEDPTATEPAIITIQQLIDRMASERGGADFLISPETGRTLTFGDLRDEARAVSALLLQAGLERGDKAAFLMDNGLFTAQLFLGTMYGGMVSVPLNVRAGVSQLAYTLEHCDAKVVFVEDQYAALAREALASVSRAVRVIPAEVDAYAREYEAPAAGAPIWVPAPEDVALLMYTSGSVGQPKAAIHSHRTVLAHGRNSRTSHQLTAADRSLLVLPIYHINAECVTLMPTLFGGGSVVVPHHFNVSQFWDLLDQYRCTWSAVVPTIISQLLDWKDAKAGERDATFQRLRFIRSSSAPLSPSLQREFMEKFPIRLIQAMGSSEAGNIFANPQAPGANKIGTPGPAWGFETRIINPEGADVAPGEPGEVLLRGQAVTRGYYKDAEQTAAVFDEKGWLHTGDLAYQDQDGYFFIVGRSKELIIKGGMNIAPRQIDEVLESHPAVLEAAVVGVPDHYLGEDLIAFAVLRSEAVGDEKAMLAFCESRLGHFKTPTRIHFVGDLPKGPSGKIQRLHLLDQAAELAATVTSFSNGHVSAEAPAETIGETIAQSWAEVLGLQEVGAGANFFSLGGHSLMAIQCLSRMREKLPIALSLADFFEHPTIAQQETLVKQRLDIDRHLNGQGRARVAEDTESQPIPLRADCSSHPLSSGQRRLWFFEELAPDVPLYNESETVRLLGELQPDAIEQAFNLIVSRHEILRTTIQMGEEGPLAVVHESWPQRIKRIDLSGRSPAARAAELERLLIDEPRLPYHLDSSPGIRATLIGIGPEEHVFILMMQHLACDWASIGAFWRELSAAYRSIVRCEQPALAGLPIQYGDYAAWQQRRVAEGAFIKDLDFWEDYLRGAPELLELPSDRPRPSVQSFRGARQRFRLSAALTEALRNCSREEKTSLFTIFAAALQTLLYRYTGTEDILVGIPIAEREPEELQKLIGFLLHIQVLRTRLSGDMTFRELLALVRKASVDAYTHREVPFEEVVNRIRPERSLSHSPIFQVLINWRDQDQHLSYVGLDGLVVESLLSETRTSKFDLTLQLTDFGNEVWLEAEYSTDLFDDDRIARMFGHYQTILEAVVANPGEKLAALPLLTEAERNQLIEWNSTDTAYPREFCIHQLFEAQAERTPEAIAVVYDGEQVTYGELNQRANQLAHHLRGLGVGPDALVGICAERSIEMVVGLLGILKAGGAYLPLDPEYPPSRLTFMLQDSGVTVLLTQGRRGARLPENQTPTIALDSEWAAIARHSTHNPASNVSGDNLAYVIYTSGSTGQPKGAMNTHSGIRNRLQWMQDEYQLSPSDSVLQKTPFSFDVSVWEFFWPLLNGARLVLARPQGHRDSEYLAGLIQEQKITTIHFVPSMLRVFLDEAEMSKCGSLRRVICSGEALSFDLQERYFSRMKAALHNLYGPTEASVDVTFWSCRADYERQLVPIGRPIANTQIHILDNNLSPVPVGVAGELYIGGAGLGRGYLNRPELTAERFIPNPFGGNSDSRLYKTGDVARHLADGNIEYLGRSDFQVKLRGFRIELGEIEAALERHPAVSQAVVVVREDVDKRLVAYLVAANLENPPGLNELRIYLRDHLPDYMVPAAFMIVCELPLNANGKIDRKALPAPELDGASSSASYLAPRTPIEEVLVEIWKRVLGLGQIGIHDNFFDMGGNSLLAVRLITEVHKSAGHRFSVASFFQDPTIAHMGSVLQEEKRAETEEEDKALHVVLRHGTKSLAIIPADAPLLTIQEGGRLPPFFVVDSFPYFIDVVRLLDEDQPVLSLVSRERAQATSSYNIAEEAARHVQTILSLPPHGPIMLGGCSASGIIAYEAARQLHDRGHKVGLVVLFDTVNPHFMRDRSALRRSLAYSGAVLKRMRWNKGPGWMAAKIGSLISTKAGVLARRTGGTHSNQGSSPQFGLSPSRIDAARRYHPGPYSGRVLVFKGERGLGGRYLDPQFGWGDVVHGKLEAYQLCSSEHLEIFKSESDRALVAGKLREAFDEVAASFRAFADRRIELSASTQYEASPNGHGEAARAGESGSLYRPSLMPASKLIGGDG